MPFKIVQRDITTMRVDAIVNAANSSLLGGGGVDGCIHRAAGKELLEECKKLGGCNTGSAKITGGYNLPCKYVIHAVGPRWQGGKQGEELLLRCCYQTSLQLAREYCCKSVAFPLISSGIYGYPKDKALGIAVDVIESFLQKNDMTVYLAVLNKGDYCIDKRLFCDIADYIGWCYADQKERRSAKPEQVCCDTMLEPCMCSDTSLQQDLSQRIQQMEETFSQMLLRKIDEKGMTDSECYKRANIDRKLFSKIRCNINYRPSKATALALAIALELPLEEAAEMLKKAGFALSHSNEFDVIVEYFILRGNYNIFEINEALFAFDQPLLGS